LDKYLSRLPQELDMTDAELLSAVAERASVSCADAQSVLQALGEIARERLREGKILSIAGYGVTTDELAVRASPGDAGEPPADLPREAPDPARRVREVEQLIAAARAHSLGLEYLLEGQLCAVATTFRTHAFTVEAARQYIREQCVAVATPRATSSGVVDPPKAPIL
jgi:hypothetical protein